MGYDIDAIYTAAGKKGDHRFTSLWGALRKIAEPLAQNRELAIRKDLSKIQAAAKENPEDYKDRLRKYPRQGYYQIIVDQVAAGKGIFKDIDDQIKAAYAEHWLQQDDQRMAAESIMKKVEERMVRRLRKSN